MTLPWGARLRSTVDAMSTIDELIDWQADLAEELAAITVAMIAIILWGLRR